MASDSVGFTFMLWVGGIVLSIMIFFKILSFGMMAAIISIMSSFGISIVLLPALVVFVPKMCTNDYSRYATIGLQLGFYMLMRSLTTGGVLPDMGKVYLYIAGYNLAYILLSAGIAFATCEDKKKE